MRSLNDLREEIITCVRCPRLVHFRESVIPRASFQSECYWKKPLPGFGDEKAWLLILGLAPAAHGGNRTGRILTGDLTAKFLFQALYEMKWANQPFSVSREDGLQLNGLYLTAAVKCVPPHDKPLPQEMRACRPFLDEEIQLLPNLKAVLALGKIAFDSVLTYAKAKGYDVRGIKFSHGAHFTFPGLFTLWGSYHPSPRNTHTGLLSYAMFLTLLKQLK